LRRLNTKAGNHENFQGLFRVFVSSFFGGNNRKIIDLWKNGHVVLCLSQDVVEEYLAVLNRLGLDDEQEISNLTGWSMFLEEATYLNKIH